MGNSMSHAFTQDFVQNCYTFPSDHLSISSRGNCARYILVVFHHKGSPRRMTACWHMLIWNNNWETYPKSKYYISPCLGLGWSRWRRRHRPGAGRQASYCSKEIELLVNNCSVST